MYYIFCCKTLKCSYLELFFAVELKNEYILIISLDVLLSILCNKLMNPNISSFVPVSHKILKYIINSGPKQYIKESIITSISPWWQFKLTEKHSKWLSAFATIHQVIAIQCISQHPYIVAVSRITVEGLDVL